MPALSFPFANPDFFFGVGPYPGSSMFDTALKFYQDELKRSEAGGGLGQLAAGQAAAPAAGAWQAATTGPSAPGGPGSGDLGYGAFSNLMRGQSAARDIGRGEQTNIRQGAVKGAGDVANAYGESIGGQLRGQMAENQAKSQNVLGAYADIANIADMATKIGSLYATGGAAAPALAGGMSGFGKGLGPFSLMNRSATPQFGSQIDPSLLTDPMEQFGSGLGPFSLMSGSY